MQSALLDEIDFEADNRLPPLIETEEDMPLRKEDWTLIHEEFDKKVEALKPRGWNRFLHFAREIGIIGSYVSIVIALLAVACSAVYFAVGRVQTEARFEQKTADDLTSVGNQLSAIRSDMDSLKVQHSSDTLLGRSALSPQAIGDAAEDLKARGVILSRQLVVNAGQSLLKQVDGNGSAEGWNATNEILSYLSFLNKTFSPPTIEVTGPPAFDTSYRYPDGWDGKTTWIGVSNPPNVPQMHLIDMPDVNAGKTTGPAYLLLDGGTLRLDHMLMKRIVVQNAKVVYDGGPLMLTNVYFVNCTFSVSHEKKGEMFIDALMSPDVQTNLTVS